MNDNNRRYFSPEQKVAILRERLTEGKAVSDLCDKHRVFKATGLLQSWNPKPSRKGNGFQQPLQPHEHWHVDISYLNIAGTFFYLCSVLDGCSRFLLHWELRIAMKELDIEIILQRAREKHPDTWPRGHSGLYVTYD